MKTSDLLPALVPLASRARQDVTWRKMGIQTRLDRKTPLSIPVLKRHLRGIEGRGVCPILEGQSTTRIVVLDLDSHKGETSWEGMAFACANVCAHFESLGYNPVSFRSTGGKGIHIFFVWDTPQDAYSARKFFATQLKELGFRDGTRGIAKGEIEIFPRQDFVPKGGYGNQFILPLTGLSAPLEPLLGYEPQEREYALQIPWPVSPDVPVLENPRHDPPKPAPRADGLSSEIKKMLAAIPNAEANYDLWIKIGMILHAETGGSPDGLALWEEWSARCPDYSGFEQLQYKWNSFRDDKAKIVTLGSLKKIAAEHGWQEDYSLDFSEVDTEEDTGEAPKEKSERFKPIRADKFLARKPPKWIIKGILPQKSTGMTYGGSGDGKTFVILDMACAIALGKPWQGRKTKRGHVVYICAEGSGGFTSRIKAYTSRNRVDPEALGNYLTVIPAAPNFMQKSDVEELIAAIKSVNKKTALIIVDTMAQTTTGADENSAKDMNIALKYLEALRSATDSAVHLIHHAGKNEDRGARGSSTLKGALDVQFQVSRNGDQRLFWVAKVKDGADGFGWNFTLDSEPIGHDEDNELQTSCVVVFDEKVVEARPAAKKRRTDAENMILKTWEDLGGGTMSVNDLVAAAAENLPHVEGSGRDNRFQQLSNALKSLSLSGDLTVLGGQVLTDLTQI